MEFNMGWIEAKEYNVSINDMNTLRRLMQSTKKLFNVVFVFPSYAGNVIGRVLTNNYGYRIKITCGFSDHLWILDFDMYTSKVRLRVLF